MRAPIFLPTVPHPLPVCVDNARTSMLGSAHNADRGQRVASKVKSRASLRREDVDAIIERARRERGLDPKLGSLKKLPTEELKMLQKALIAAGLEHTDKYILVPVREQVRALLRHHSAGMTAAQLSKAVKGGNQKDLREGVRIALAALVKSKELALVPAGSTTRYVVSGSHLLSPSELTDADEAVTKLAKLLSPTRKTRSRPQRTLPRSELTTLIRQLYALVEGEVESDDNVEFDEAVRRKAPTSPDTKPVRSALEVALRKAPTHTGLIRVPEVVASLEARYPRKELLSELLDLASEGGVELTPESGIGRLKADERARCPIGMDGTPLSYARLLDNQPGAMS